MLRAMLRPLAVVFAFAFSSVLLSQQPEVPAAPQQSKPEPAAPAKPEPAVPAKPETGGAAKPEASAVPVVPTGAADLDPVELAKAMNATMRLATPGPQHEQLCALEGYHEVVMELTPPGVPAQTFAGEARAMAVLGGRYLLVNLRVRLAGVMMEGLYLFGFDNLRQTYTMSWRDSLSTWAVDCYGPLPEKDPSRVPMKGVLVDAASPTGREFEVVLQFRDGGLGLDVIDQVKDQRVVVMKQRFVRKPDPRAKDESAAKEPATGDGKR